VAAPGGRLEPDLAQVASEVLQFLTWPPLPGEAAKSETEAPFGSPARVRREPLRPIPRFDWKRERPGGSAGAPMSPRYFRMPSLSIRALYRA
jgi:hypothetical protein